MNRETLRFAGAILAGSFVWLAYTLAMLPLILLGFPFVGLALWRGWFKANMVPGDCNRLDFSKRWLWLWGNDEDGVDGCIINADGSIPARNKAWFEKTFGWDHGKIVFSWSCLRNSVGNARRVPFFGIAVEPKNTVLYIPGIVGKVIAAKREGVCMEAWWRDYRGTGPYVARNRWAFELRFPWPGRKRQFWIGWRIAQQDEFNTQVGFAMQLWGKV